MQKQGVQIANIPAILWGEKSDKIFIAVHGNMSNKADDVIVILAQEAAEKGYQTLSFDLPEHGDRKDEGIPCKVQNCVQDLYTVMRYAKSLSGDISIFACSMGAYFSLLAYSHEPLKQALFLSPVVNMERLINNMLGWYQLDINRLEKEKEIKTPDGQIFYWDYYLYLKEHPIVGWDCSTSILYGEADNLCEIEVVQDFTARFQCNLRVMEAGEHYFHTPEQLAFYRQWLKERIL
jgi:uncharacterized protein